MEEEETPTQENERPNDGWQVAIFPKRKKTPQMNKGKELFKQNRGTRGPTETHPNRNPTTTLSHPKEPCFLEELPCNHIETDGLLINCGPLSQLTAIPPSLEQSGINATRPAGSYLAKSSAFILK